MKITEEQMYDFCKSHYYCDDEFKVKWEPVENYDDDDIEEMIDNDVHALKHFLKEK